MVQRDTTYLNWRYLDPRGGNFWIRAVEKNGELRGFSVLTINRFSEDYPVGSLVDLVAENHDSEVISTLLDDAVDYFKEKGVNLIKTRLIRNHPYTRDLTRHGFVDTLKNTYPIYRVFSEIGTHIEEFVQSQPYEAHYMYGDLDTY